MHTSCFIYIYIYIFLSVHNDVTIVNYVRVLYSFSTLNDNFYFNGIIIIMVITI
jgi:hypothetical protein